MWCRRQSHVAPLTSAFGEPHTVWQLLYPVLMANPFMHPGGPVDPHAALAPVAQDHDGSDRGLCVAEVRRLIWERVKTLDARSAAEHLRHRLEGSVHVGMRPSARQLQHLGLEPHEPLICLSNGGTRARQLNAHLRALGYRHAYHLSGGLGAVAPSQGA